MNWVLLDNDSISFLHCILM